LLLPPSRSLKLFIYEAELTRRASRLDSHHLQGSSTPHIHTMGKSKQKKEKAPTEAAWIVPGPLQMVFLAYRDVFVGGLAATRGLRKIRTILDSHFPAHQHLTKSISIKSVCKCLRRALHEGWMNPNSEARRDLEKLPPLSPMETTEVARGYCTAPKAEVKGKMEISGPRHESGYGIEDGTQPNDPDEDIESIPELDESW
jgi:hypothetical protein